MDTVQSEDVPLNVVAENVGGIGHTEIELRPGVNVLAGRNATNRTSFLQAIMAGLGSGDVSLKGDADHGQVELRLGEETYTRTLRRVDDGVAFDGDPYLADSTVADLYAFLLGDNEARRAVERGDDLHDVIMRPVDTEEIRSQIERVEDERRRLADELSELDGLAERRAERRQRIAELERELETKRATLAEKRATLEEADADVAERREQQAEFDEAMTELDEVRSRLEDVRFSLETKRDSLASAREQRADLADELSSLDPVSTDADLADRIDHLRGEKRSVESRISRLQNILQFNREMLEGDDELLAVLREDGGPGSVTDQLLAREATTCWTCGSEVGTGQIEGMLDRLQEAVEAQRRERNRLADELDELTARRREIEEQRERSTELEERIERLDGEIADRERAIEELEAEKADLVAEIEELETAVEEQGTDDLGELLELHREVNELEFEIEQLESELEERRAEVAELDERLDQREELEARRTALGDDLEELRTRIGRIETDAVERFNEHMDHILDRLAYENVERIWIERRTTERREGRRTVERAEFALHVVRTTESGRAYEDTVDHLSESEREVTGLVFALAGYLVHEVYERVPVMLLDSLEAIDAERIANLVDYFAGFADYHVVALLPEDAEAVGNDHHLVTEI
jgi:DNA repair exonuclease SbcCD ATPase subunit